MIIIPKIISGKFIFKSLKILNQDKFINLINTFFEHFKNIEKLHSHIQFIKDELKNLFKYLNLSYKNLTIIRYYDVYEFSD